MTAILPVAVFRDSLATPEIFYLDKEKSTQESLYCFKELAKGRDHVKIVAREVAPIEQFYSSLGTEQLQLFFSLMENCDVCRLYLDCNSQLKELRSTYAGFCQDIVTTFQKDESERTERKKAALQSEIRCIYDIVKKRDNELSEEQARDLKRIVTELIDKTQTELDNERLAAVGAMEEMLQAETAKFESQEQRLVTVLTQCEQTLAAFGVTTRSVLDVLILSEIFECQTIKPLCMELARRWFDQLADANQWHSPVLAPALSSLLDGMEAVAGAAGSDGTAAASAVRRRSPTRSRMRLLAAAAASTAMSPPSPEHEQTQARRFLDAFLDGRIERQKKLDLELASRAADVARHRVHAATVSPATRIAELIRVTPSLSPRSPRTDSPLLPQSTSIRAMSPRGKRSDSPTRAGAATPTTAATAAGTPRPRVVSPVHSAPVLQHPPAVSVAAIGPDAHRAAQELRETIVKEHHETVRTATASLRTDIEQLRGELDGVLGRVRASIVAAAQCTRLAPPHTQHQPAAGAAAAAKCAGFMVRYDGSIPVAVLAERALQHAEAVLRGRQSLSRAALVSGTSSAVVSEARLTASADAMRPSPVVAKAIGALVL